MRPVWAYLRSGVTVPVFLVALGAVVGAVATTSDWHLEMDWGLRLTSSTVAFVSPLVAAAAAFDTARRHHPTFAALARAGARGPVLQTIPALGVAAAGITAYIVAWIGIWVVVLRRGGVMVTDYWALPETAVPIVGAAMVGGMVGRLIKGLGAPLAAAGLVLLGAVVASPWGRGPFEAVTTYGTLTGLERPPAQAMATVVSGVVTVVIAFLLIGGSQLRPPAPWVKFALLAALVPVWIAPSAYPWPDQVFRISSEPTACVGTEPSLCGPQSRVPLLAMAQPSFARAYSRLGGTPFRGPSAFRVTRLDQYSQLEGAAPLDFDPSGLANGREYEPNRIASALLRPHQCKGLFDAEDSVPILAAQSMVTPWLVDVVSGQRSGRPVPTEVLTAFSTIENCDVYTGDLT